MTNSSLYKEQELDMKLLWILPSAMVLVSVVDSLTAFAQGLSREQRDEVWQMLRESESRIIAEIRKLHQASNAPRRVVIEDSKGPRGVFVEGSGTEARVVIQRRPADQEESRSRDGRGEPRRIGGSPDRGRGDGPPRGRGAVSRGQVRDGDGQRGPRSGGRPDPRRVESLRGPANRGQSAKQPSRRPDGDRREGQSRGPEPVRRLEIHRVEKHEHHHGHHGDHHHSHGQNHSSHGKHHKSTGRSTCQPCAPVRVLSSCNSCVSHSAPVVVRRVQIVSPSCATPVYSSGTVISEQVLRSGPRAVIYRGAGCR